MLSTELGAITFIISCHQHASAIIQSHRLSSKVTCCHQESSAVIKNHQLSSTVISCFQESSAIINSHQLPSPIIGCFSAFISCYQLLAAICCHKLLSALNSLYYIAVICSIINHVFMFKFSITLNFDKEVLEPKQVFTDFAVVCSSIHIEI